GLVHAVSRCFDVPAQLLRAAPAAGVAAPWHRYLAGVLRQLPEAPPRLGARLLIAGDLPATGGLSSSSSLTMGLLGGLNALWQLGLSPTELVARGIVAERHVGVESGGMDQTVITMGRRGAALHIAFAPPARRIVPLPAGLRLVAAFSGEEAPKGGAVQQAYNERVIGCRLAAALLARRLGCSAGQPPVLGAVVQAAGRASGDAAGEALAALAALVAQLPRLASASAVAGQLGQEVEPLVALTAGRAEAERPVLVRPVAHHVLGEASRVALAEAALRAGDLAGFGRLLDASHRSLAEDFRCSTPALDRLCDALRRAGARGARLTGAGFGGYALAALAPEHEPVVLAAARAATGGPAFAVTASDGLSVERLDQGGEERTRR
ncbi:MAG: hypothetical protein FJ125_10265, partial [Deltaproteobacteria bacterium]|nr:hypothetical protein [Deltaproteobacteria bacterium]